MHDDEHVSQALTSTSAGFKDRGNAPHIITGAQGHLYQNSKDANHFVHTTPGGKWSSFHTDGKTSNIKREGSGTTTLKLHLSGAMHDYSVAHPGFAGAATIRSATSRAGNPLPRRSENRSVRTCTQ